MKISVNDRPLELTQPLTLTALLEQIKRHQPGTALAINRTIIPRADWDHHWVQDGDDILLFQAIAGG
ncbi:sulfur carrier protein ThiS [Serratia sp. NPDC078593]|uniref:sulfur carrier protein ThiS n=1 Tax=unclassified Serratia (in: enterobacteria) TaxID=2647522 RepID=UPI0037D014FB